MSAVPRPPRAALLLLLTVLAALSGCGGSRDDPPAPAPRTLVLAELDTSDSEVVGELYRRLLDQAGFSTSVRTVPAREVYVDLLERGKVQLVGDYLSSAADAVHRADAGEDAETVGSPDEATALRTLTDLAGQHGITVLAPTRAEVGTQYVVTAALARARGLRTLSDLGRDLGRRGGAVSLAVAPDCLPSADCTQGLEQTYGVRLDRVVPLEGDTLTALRGGGVQLAQVTTTDPALDSPDLVALQDDRSLVDAENVLPLVSTDWLRAHRKARAAVAPLATVLTTADLRALVTRVARDGQDVGDVVQAYLVARGLVQG